MNIEGITRIENELKIKLPEAYKKVMLSYPFKKEDSVSKWRLLNNPKFIINHNKSPGVKEIVKNKIFTNHNGENTTVLYIGDDGGEIYYFLDISKENGAIYGFDFEMGPAEFKLYVQGINEYIEKIQEIDESIEEDKRRARERGKEENQTGFDASYLEYFKNNAQKFDDQHLEAALYLLKESKLHDGYREIVKYIEHPTRYVRFGAIKAIVFLKDEDFDDFILNEAKRVVQKNINNIEYVELKERLEKLPGFKLE
jgi:hypothetical protein